MANKVRFISENYLFDLRAIPFSRNLSSTKKYPLLISKSQSDGDGEADSIKEGKSGEIMTAVSPKCAPSL